MRPGTVPPPAPQYFVDMKKWEVNELRQLLKNVQTEKDQNKKREVIKKVIAYMTLGIDVSRLFSDMVMASSTPDLVQKKMIYHYLVNYAESQPDLALMAINTFLKDCKQSPDAKVRGLALRTLCSLRVSSTFEYLQQAITEGLNDGDPYVRRTAILGALKLWRGQKNSDFIDTLYAMIRDPDPTVSTNSLQALDEMLQDEGGIAINRKMIVYLLNNIKKYNEFGQQVILDLAARYGPKDEEEKFDIMNILEDRLRHSSSCVVLGTIKVFINYTKEDVYLKQQVFQRVATPLITLMVGGETVGSFEMTFTILAHIYQLILDGAAPVFEPEYKQFFCRYDEPSYIKSIKLDILTLIANDTSLHDILNEMTEYVTDVDNDLARKCLESMGRIASRLSSASYPIFQTLIKFLGLAEYVQSAALAVMQDLLRSYDLASEVPQVIQACQDSVLDLPAKQAFIWMLGEYDIEEGPYILEPFVNNVKETPTLIPILLSACVKLFFRRAPEVYPILQNLFKNISDIDNPDWKDRAMWYYELLKNPELAKQVVQSPPKLQLEPAKSKISYEEFNTLAVIYQKPLPKKQIEAQEITFDKTAELDQEEYQDNWFKWETAAQFQRKLSRPVTTEEMESMMAQKTINCIASGEPEEGQLKFYFYARNETGLVLSEVLVQQSDVTSVVQDYTLSAVVKSQREDLTNAFVKCFESAIASIVASNNQQVQQQQEPPKVIEANIIDLIEG